MHSVQAVERSRTMNKSHLLINEQALQVLPSIAVLLGLNEAIALQQVHYWLNNQKNTGRVDDQGNKWVYNTYSQWQEDNFPFWSVDKVQRVFLSLEKQGVLIAEQLDAKSRDMTKFYRIDYDKLCMMDDAILRPSNTANLHDVKMNQRLPENTTAGISENLKTDEQKPEYITRANQKMDALLEMANFPGAKTEARIDSILSYLGETFHRNTETAEWRKFAKYIDSEKKLRGWDVTDFVKWLFSQEGYKPEFWPVKKMIEFYPSAFTGEVAHKTDDGREEGKGFYA